MKNIIKLLVCTAHFFWSISAFAFIYEVKILKKWDAAHKRYHYFIGFSDFHDKVHVANKHQLAKIETILNTCDKNSTKVAIEDLSSINNNGRSACGRYSVNSRGGVLGGLAQTSRTMGLDVANVEFRYCRVISLGPVLNNLQGNLNSFPSATTTTMSALLDEVSKEIVQIQAYDDGPILKKLYDASIKNIQDQIKKLRLDLDGTLSVAQYLEKNSTQKNRLELLKNLLTFDSGLLDLSLAHIVTSAFGTQDKVIVIAGGAHIGRVSDLLQKVGYKDASTTKVTFARENDLRKCLGSNIIDGAFCVKPQPIALDFLDAILF